MSIENIVKTLLGINKRKVIRLLKAKGRLSAVKLYKETYNCSLTDAVYKVNKWFGLTGNDKWTDHYDTYGNTI